MGWATPYIAQLQQEETVQFRPSGNSMSGKIDSGQLVTVAPIGDRKLAIGDMIGNNRGRINGWTQRRNIFGIVTAVTK